MRRHLLSIASALFLLNPALHAAPSAPRQIQQFTKGWRFLQSDAPNAQQPAFDDASWQTVTLPHDWAIAGPVDPSNPTGQGGGFFPASIGWYRKTFAFNPKPGHHTFIVFDGVMANSDVYCNGALLGHHPYGYTSFYYDLTPHLRAGKNLIAVRVDDFQQPASRWYPERASTARSASSPSPTRTSRPGAPSSPHPKSPPPARPSTFAAASSTNQAAPRRSRSPSR